MIVKLKKEFGNDDTIVHFLKNCLYKKPMVDNEQKWVFCERQKALIWIVIHSPKFISIKLSKKMPINGKLQEFHYTRFADYLKKSVKFLR